MYKRRAFCMLFAGFASTLSTIYFNNQQYVTHCDTSVENMKMANEKLEFFYAKAQQKTLPLKANYHPIACSFSVFRFRRFRLMNFKTASTVIISCFNYWITAVCSFKFVCSQCIKSVSVLSTFVINFNLLSSVSSYSIMDFHELFKCPEKLIEFIHKTDEIHQEQEEFFNVSNFDFWNYSYSTIRLLFLTILYFKGLVSGIESKLQDLLEDKLQKQEEFAIPEVPKLKKDAKDKRESRGLCELFVSKFSVLFSNFSFYQIAAKKMLSMSEKSINPSDTIIISKADDDPFRRSARIASKVWIKRFTFYIFFPTLKTCLCRARSIKKTLKLLLPTWEVHLPEILLRPFPVFLLRVFHLWKFVVQMTQNPLRVSWIDFCTLWMNMSIDFNL